MDLSFIGEQLGNFETFGKGVYAVLHGFAEFAKAINVMVDTSDALSTNTEGAFSAAFGSSK